MDKEAIAGEFDLEARLRVLLPETYEVFDDDVRPVSMGSAGLKFGADGGVLWGEMWGSFCDLAMAGGPPHRGRLLQPSCGSDGAACAGITAEICRGISLVTGLCAEASPSAGWVQMYCPGAAMADWLVRAIVMENVSAFRRGLALLLPTGPDFRVEKEVKNVITAAAKTCHYWQAHMSEGKHEEIARLLAEMERDGPLVQPDFARETALGLAEDAARGMAEAIQAETGLERANQDYADWIGFDCREVPAAIWMMRALVAGNVLSRREETLVFLPVSLRDAGARERGVWAMGRAFREAKLRGVFA